MRLKYKTTGSFSRHKTIKRLELGVRYCSRVPYFHNLLGNLILCKRFESTNLNVHLKLDKMN